MKTSNGWKVVRCRNLYTRKWKGAWFAFSRTHGGRIVEEGKAHHSTLAAYIGPEAFKQVEAHFACLNNRKENSK